MVPAKIPTDGLLHDPDVDVTRTWTNATDEDLYHLKMIGSMFYNVKFLDNEYGGESAECVARYLRSSQASVV